MNAFQYGNQQRRERKIHLTFELHHDKLVIRVVYQGAGFRLEDVPEPREDENVLEDSGRGVPSMEAWRDQAHVSSRATGGAVVLFCERHKRQAVWAI